MTSPSAPPGAVRPSDPAAAALFDAVGAEHGAIYGYGLVSAHSSPDVNALVSTSLAGHRDAREKAIATLSARKLTAPVPAAGYRIPITVDGPTAAAKLAVTMEQDCATAWRAVLEQATAGEDRELAVAALTRCAVTAAQWRAVLGIVPSTVAFPGGSE